MKGILTSTLIIILCLGLCACSENAEKALESTEPQQSITPSQQPIMPSPSITDDIEPDSDENNELSAEGLLQAFKDAGMPIIDEVIHTSETDPNGMLGRPNEYIAKINFNDSRFFEPGDDPKLTVEFFSKKSDMEKRRDYVQSIVDSSNSSLFKYYIYDIGLFLFRIPYVVTPEAASIYEEIFTAYMNNEPILTYDIAKPIAETPPASGYELVQYKSISFLVDNLYPIDEDDDDVLTITIDPQKTIIQIMSIDTSDLGELTSTVLELLLSSFLSDLETQMVEKGDITVADTTASSATYIANLDDSWYNAVTVVFSDDKWGYMINFFDSNYEYAEDFISFIESITFDT